MSTPSFAPLRPGVQALNSPADDVTTSRAELRLPLSTSADEVPRARRLVRSQLRTWGLQVHEDTTELLVSELVANALRHGQPPLELRVKARNDGGVRVEVLDAAGSKLPALDVTPPDSDTGRGVEIVAALATRWGSESADTGKLVWAELDRHVPQSVGSVPTSSAGPVVFPDLG